jgi:minor extracellular protease Epr
VGTLSYGDLGYGGVPLGQGRASDEKSRDWPQGKKLDFGDKDENWGNYLEQDLEFGSFSRAKDQGATEKAERGEDRKREAGQSRSKDGRKSAQSTDRAINPRSYAHEQVLAINLSPAALDRARSLGFQVTGADQAENAGDVTILTAPPGVDALDALEQLRKDLPAERFLLNRIYRLYHPAMREEDEKSQRTEPATFESTKRCTGDRCYGRALIHWKDSLASCARDLKVGVIDTEIDPKHPAFGGRNIIVKRFIADGKRPAENWHGTGVLAVLGGRPDSGTPGLIPDAAFFAASIFFAGDDGDAATDTVALLKALDWMRSANVKLINMSFSGPQDDLVQARVESMSAQGFVFVAAAGNDGPAADPAYPAAYPQVIAVTAVGKDMRNYPYANRGPHIDVAAPGVGVWTAVPGSREGYRSGTSFAAPFATAVLSLMSQDRPITRKETLLEEAKISPLSPRGGDPIYGRGLLQAPQTCFPGTGRIADRAPQTEVAPR